MKKITFKQIFDDYFKAVFESEYSIGQGGEVLLYLINKHQENNSENSFVINKSDSSNSIHLDIDVLNETLDYLFDVGMLKKIYEINDNEIAVCFQRYSQRNNKLIAVTSKYLKHCDIEYNTVKYYEYENKN